MTNSTPTPQHPQDLETGSARRIDDLPDLLTIDELSQFLSVSKSTLYSWNMHNDGPAPVKMGKHLRYPKQTVLDWMQNLTRR